VWPVPALIDNTAEYKLGKQTHGYTYQWNKTSSNVDRKRDQSTGIHGDTTWGEHANWVSVPSGTGTTLVSLIFLRNVAGKGPKRPDC
jgi:hypothetical protein